MKFVGNNPFATSRKRIGFFMTEFLIYLVLSSFIAVFIMRYIYSTTLRLRATTLQTDRIACVHSALDALAFDLERAPTAVENWRILNQAELAWQQKNIRVGWKLDKGILKRYMQGFDKKEDRWKQTVSHVALEDVQGVHFTPHYNERDLDAITVSITGCLASGKTHACTRIISLSMEMRI